MQFPFETKTEDGHKATVLGALPDGRLIGYLEFKGTFTAWEWGADGSHPVPRRSITLPLQIKPLTTYRTRDGGIAWTSGRVRGGRISGLIATGDVCSWLVNDGRWSINGERPFDLIEELPPGTTE